MGKSLVPMFMAVVLAVGLSLGGAFFLWGRNTGHAPAAAKGGATESVLTGDLKSVSLDTFTTNLADSDKHFIQVTFILVPKDDKTGEKLNGVKPVLRDAVLTLLRTRTQADVHGAEGKANLVAAVQARMDELVGKGAVQRVLVTDLVVQ